MYCRTGCEGGGTDASLVERLTGSRGCSRSSRPRSASCPRSMTPPVGRGSPIFGLGSIAIVVGGCGCAGAVAGTSVRGTRACTSSLVRVRLPPVLPPSRPGFRLLPSRSATLPPVDPEFLPPSFLPPSPPREGCRWISPGPPLTIRLSAGGMGAWKPGGACVQRGLLYHLFQPPGAQHQPRLLMKTHRP